MRVGIRRHALPVLPPRKRPGTYCASGDRIPVGARFSAPVHTGPGAHPASCTMGTGSFPRVKSGRGVTLTPHLLLVPWSRKSRAIPLLPLCAVRPVHCLSSSTFCAGGLLDSGAVLDGWPKSCLRRDSVTVTSNP
jgi:hypothetical protein